MLHRTAPSENVAPWSPHIHAWERKGGKCLALDGVFLDPFYINCLKFFIKRRNRIM